MIAPVGETPVEVDTNGITLKLAIGEIEGLPTAGTFLLFCNGITSSAINYNATASEIYTAVSNNVSTVTTFGSESYSYILTATGTNTAMSFSSNSNTLFPSSTVIVSTRRGQAASVQSQETLKLRTSPAIIPTTFSAAATANVVTLNLLQDGSSTTTVNETYEITIGKDAVGGSYLLNYGSNSTTGLSIYASAVSVQEALQSVTGIGIGNISVNALNRKNGHIIQFVRGLGNTNITTALRLDASGVVFSSILEGTVTMNTNGLNELFASSASNEVAPTLEIEMTKGGISKTILQDSVTIKKDLILN